MRFTVPQFIDREAKVIGPFTFKQAVIMGVALLVSVILYFTMGPSGLFILSIIVILGSSAGLIFLKVQGKSLPALILELLKYKMSPKTFMWQNDGRDLDAFSKDGIAIGEIDFENPDQIKKTEDTNLDKLAKQH